MQKEWEIFRGDGLMAQMNLFGTEATAIVQGLKKEKKSKAQKEVESHTNPSIVYLREEDYGYRVININAFKFFPSRSLIGSWGFEVMKNYNVTKEQYKEDFVKEVMKCYDVKEVKWTKQLQNEDGSFMLDGVEVKYSFRTDYFSHDGKPCQYPSPHLEFKTEVPTIISETGYRSEFLTFDYNNYNSVQEIIDDFIIHYRSGK